MPSSNPYSGLLAELNRLGVNGYKYLTSGSVFFVDSTATEALDSDDGRHGHSWEFPMATIDDAIALCTANAGDIIFVGAKHIETITATAVLDCDIAGISIIGVGEGRNSPLITLGATAATIEIAAANVTLKNLRFTIAAANVTQMIDVNAAGFTMEDCHLTMNVTSYEAEDAINITGAASSCGGATVRNCQIFGASTAGSNAGIELGEVADQVVIEGCTIMGAFSEACIHNPTGKVLTFLFIKDCICLQVAASCPAIELVSACTGVISDCRLYADDDALILDPGSCYCFETYGIDAVDEGAYIRPAVGSP